MITKEPETLRISLAPHVGENLGFSGYVEQKKTNSGHYHVCVTSVVSDNDPGILLNHVWLTVTKHDFDYVSEGNFITFSGKVVNYRKAKKLTKDGLASVDDYTIELIKNVQVRHTPIGATMYQTLGNTTPFIAPAKKNKLEIPIAPVVIEKAADKKSIFEILLDKKMTLNGLSRKFGINSGNMSTRMLSRKPKAVLYTQSQKYFAEGTDFPIEKIDFQSQDKAVDYHLFAENIRHKNITETAVKLNTPVETPTKRTSGLPDDFTLWIPFSDWCEQHGQQPSKHLFTQWKEFKDITA